MKSFLMILALSQSFFWMGAAENPNARGCCGLLACFLLLLREEKILDFIGTLAKSVDAIGRAHMEIRGDCLKLIDDVGELLGGLDDEEEEPEQATH